MLYKIKIINRDISKNNEYYKIYKRIGNIENSKVGKALINTREDYKMKLRMALLSPDKNQLKIQKFKKILNSIDWRIKNRFLRGEPL